LDDGRLTDNKGRMVNFKNTIIIMTSNIGSDVIQQNYEEMSEANEDEVMQKTKDQVWEMLKQSVRPEFLNRVDETIMFSPLSREDVRKIVQLQIDALNDRLEQQNLELQTTEHALDWIAEAGFDPQFGARPIQRVIQKQVMNELSKKLIAGEVDQETPIVLDTFDGKLVFRKPVEETTSANGQEKNGA
jgi:ATP-dependent Clp protease ATP-binding subunit ClpB